MNDKPVWMKHDLVAVWNYRWGTENKTQHWNEQLNKTHFRWSSEWGFLGLENTPGSQAFGRNML